MSDDRDRRVADVKERLAALLDEIDEQTRRPSEKSLRQAVAEQARQNLAAAPCSMCSGPTRETVGMVCQTCGTDYAPNPS